MDTKKQRRYDLITIGRCGVDLYANQIGDGLESSLSFNKYVGGCPGNIAIGTSRLGLRVAMLTRVGMEQMGNYLMQTFADEGVDTSHIIKDEKRLTTLVLLSIKDSKTFPLLYYRQNCADMGLCEEDIDPNLIADSHSILVSGVHLSDETTAKALFKALDAAKKANTQVIFDIDYRPVLWGLTGLGEGENRFIANEEVTKNIQRILPMCDLIVGTDEEFNIAGGSEDPIESLRNVRSFTQATFVFKMGPQGCCVMTDDIPDVPKPTGRPFAVSVLNTVGAGDAFMSGFLSGYLRGDNWETCATKGNASGALVVSRHGCSPESPSAAELQFFMNHRESLPERPDMDPSFRRLHIASNKPRIRGKETRNLALLAFDHRSQFEEMRQEAGIAKEDGRKVIVRAKSLLFKALENTRKQADKSMQIQFGLICDERYGEDVLRAATGEDYWVGRPVEKPKSYPLEYDFDKDISMVVESTPASHTLKCLFFYNSEDTDEVKARQNEQLARLYHICDNSRHDLLLEILPAQDVLEANREKEIIKGISSVYANNIFPDWWKLPGFSSDAWKEVEALIESKDAYCNGIVLLGLDKPMEQLEAELAIAAHVKKCKGFAIGRSVFAEAVRNWMASNRNEEADRVMVEQVMKNFKQLLNAWNNYAASKEANN